MVTISGDTKLFGLLSHGAHFTLSPAMHNHAARILAKDVVYVNFDLPRDRVQSFLDVFWHLGGIGLNVTMPHKSQVASMVKSNGLTSVNTLVRVSDGWEGFSTDGLGFLSGLTRAKAEISDFDAVVVLGAGGATRSILAAIAEATSERPLVTVIHRRSRVSDHNLLQAVSTAPTQMITIREMTPEAFADTLSNLSGLRKLVIQATSAPKNGDSLATYATALRHLNARDLLVDIIYDHPSEIYFEAIRQDLRCLDGMPMLIEQARLSQLKWWGKAASYEEMLLAVKNSGWRPR